MTQIQTGNAELDAKNGWFVGSFIEKELGLRHSDEVELKWCKHPAGEERPEWVTGETRTTIGILISGKFEMIFRNQTFVASKPGDFVMWGKGTDHKWRALEDSIWLTVRWPSIRQY
jgi:hypothetical protein